MDIMKKSKLLAFESYHRRRIEKIVDFQGHLSNHKVESFGIINGFFSFGGRCGEHANDYFLIFLDSEGRRTLVWEDYYATDWDLPLEWESPKEWDSPSRKAFLSIRVSQISAHRIMVNGKPSSEIRRGEPIFEVSVVLAFVNFKFLEITVYKDRKLYPQHNHDMEIIREIDVAVEAMKRYLLLNSSEGRFLPSQAGFGSLVEYCLIREALSNSSFYFPPELDRGGVDKLFSRFASSREDRIDSVAVFSPNGEFDLESFLFRGDRYLEARRRFLTKISRVYTEKLISAFCALEGDSESFCKFLCLTVRGDDNNIRSTKIISSLRRDFGLDFSSADIIARNLHQDLCLGVFRDPVQVSEARERWGQIGVVTDIIDV